MNDNPENPQQPVPPAPGAGDNPPQTPADPYGQPAAPADPYGQPAAPADPYGQPAAPSDPYGQPAAPADPYGQPAAPYGQPAAPADPYGQPAAPADPYGQPAAPYGQPAPPYGQPGPEGAGYPGAAPSYPGAAPSYPGAAPAPGAVDQNGYPLAPPPAPRKPLPKGALIGIIAGAAVIVLGIAAAIVVPIVTRAPQVSASDFVEGYLSAVADGDAEKALEYVEPNGDDDLLTDDVLGASLKLNAIDDIVVSDKESESKYGDALVSATFTIGDTEISRDFEVYVPSDGEGMYIINGLVRLSAPYGFDGLDLTVNGAEVPDYTNVFPGTYQFAVGLDAFAIEGESTFVLADETSAEALYDVKPVLSEEGTATFRELVNASFAECLAMKTLSTPCGMDVTDMSQDGYTPVDGTVTRTLDAEAQSKLANIAPYVSERAIVTTMDYWSADIKLQAQKGGSTADFEVLFGARILSPKVDFAAETPAVVWE